MKVLMKCECGNGYWENEFEQCEMCLRQSCYVSLEDVYSNGWKWGTQSYKVRRNKWKIRKFLYY